MIVGHLSGKYEVNDDFQINGRWSASERIKTRIYLKSLLRTLGIDAKESNYISRNLNPFIDLILNPYKGTNIYGIIPSTVPSGEYIILGAHYDTGKRGAPGAVDNATGIALIYIVAKELIQHSSRNKNLIIVFFDQEEEELIGSKAFKNLIKKEKWDVHSIHCFDMVGWDGNNDFAMEVFSPSEDLIDSYRTAAKRHDIPLKEILIDPVGYNRHSTDFDAFVPGGYNVIGAGECFYHRDSSPFKDSPKDTYETVNFSYLLSCTNLIQNIITEMVNS